MVVGVVFNGDFNSKVYHYKEGDFQVRPMDKVLVPCGSYGHIEVAMVVSVFADTFVKTTFNFDTLKNNYRSG